MLAFDTFLGCIPLKRGSFIIGLTSTVAAILRVIVYSVLADQITRVTPEIMLNKAYLYSVQGMLFAIIFVSFVEFFLGLCLIYGTGRNHSGYINAWVLSQRLLILVDFICYLLLSLIYIVAAMLGPGIGILVYGVVHAVITWYFYVVVRSHHRDLRFSTYPEE